VKLPLLLLAVSVPSAMLFAQPPSPPAMDQAALTAGNNAFAVDLYGQLRTQPGNLFFSPASISTAFAMAYAGAHGETATQMATVFHFTLPPAQLHPAMGALFSEMNMPHAGYELRVADALWAQQDAQFLTSYLDLTKADYGAGLHRVDFRSSPDSVRLTINEWIEQQTDKKIQNLIAPGVLTPATRLVLTNAIYFKGTWLNPFDKSLSEDEDFHLSATQTAKVSMMHRAGSYRYYDGGTFRALELPYQGNDLSMVVFLPKDIAGLTALEQSFTSAAASDWLQHLAPAPKVILSLPRFTMTQQFELSSALKGMGMPLAFSGAADFSGMTGKPDFTISAAIHKAFIDVNEQGTEAAAATAIVMRSLAMRSQQPEPPPIVFRADHPFLILIRQTQSGAILFMGRVDDPAK
jgi:serpin B